MLVNSWRLWHLVKKDRKDKSLLYFLRQVVSETLRKHGEPKTRSGVCFILIMTLTLTLTLTLILILTLAGPSMRLNSIRADRKDHWIIESKLMGVCQNCRKRSSFTLYHMS
jgi:hypothetical protein